MISARIKEQRTTNHDLHTTNNEPRTTNNDQRTTIHEHNTMKHILILSLFLVGCSSNAPRPVANTEQAANANSQSKDVKSVLAHSGENQSPRLSANSNGGSGKWSRSGDPVDTTVYDSAIADAEKDHKAKPTDDGAKTALAQAYFDRGFALTEARQYASALGDYRRALKLDPDHAESKKWIAQIEGIYASINKTGPKEGEEPPPLPMEKPER